MLLKIHYIFLHNFQKLVYIIWLFWANKKIFEKFMRIFRKVKNGQKVSVSESFRLFDKKKRRFGGEIEFFLLNMVHRLPNLMDLSGWICLVL